MIRLETEERTLPKLAQDGAPLRTGASSLAGSAAQGVDGAPLRTGASSASEDGTSNRARPGARLGLPSVSVLIPARNAEADVGGALDGVLAQDYRGPVEVVVADGSDRPSLEAVLRERYPDVRVVANPGRVAASGLNAALEVATGDVVVRCDAHATLSPGHVRRAVEALQRTGAANVGGSMRAVGDTFFGRAVALALPSLLGSGGSRHKFGGAAGPVDTVYLGAFSRRALDQVGGFNVATPVNEDFELNWRLRERGWTVWFEPSLGVRYRTRRTWRALARQYLGYGWSKRRTMRRHPSSLGLRQVAAVLPAAGLAASAVLALAGAPAAAWALVPASYAGLLLASALAAGARRRDPAAILVPVVLATMHLAWAAGLFVPSAFFLPKQVRRSLAARGGGPRP